MGSSKKGSIPEILQSKMPINCIWPRRRKKKCCSCRRWPRVTNRNRNRPRSKWNERRRRKEGNWVINSPFHGPSDALRNKDKKMLRMAKRGPEEEDEQDNGRGPSGRREGGRKGRRRPELNGWTGRFHREVNFLPIALITPTPLCLPI